MLPAKENLMLFKDLLLEILGQRLRHRISYGLWMLLGAKWSFQEVLGGDS
jgi:hypothetical protein